MLGKLSSVTCESVTEAQECHLAKTYFGPLGSKHWACFCLSSCSRFYLIWTKTKFPTYSELLRSLWGAQVATGLSCHLRWTLSEEGKALLWQTFLIWYQQRMERTHICMCTLFPVAAERFLGKVGAARTK